jgi:hypothetical protein
MTPFNGVVRSMNESLLPNDLLVRLRPTSLRRKLKGRILSASSQGPTGN